MLAFGMVRASKVISQSQRAISYLACCIFTTCKLTCRKLSIQAYYQLLETLRSLVAPTLLTGCYSQVLLSVSLLTVEPKDFNSLYTDYMRMHMLVGCLKHKLSQTLISPDISHMRLYNFRWNFGKTVHMKCEHTYNYIYRKSRLT